ncbi:UDP-N-acetylmuramoyl-tripeptide--D-alanyl-D-alanine ligase [Candidatus Babeliales bacterium]|nr:UDP-N-acetylmuramoyl-tripeptide--D-alanyl-D-alanine ligase [Candidatus Babeliales bacterium]
MSINIYFLRYALPNSEKINDNIFEDKNIAGINIDSRNIKKDEIFLALNGENFDGHDFLESALDNGAIGLIIEKSKEQKLNKIKKEKLENTLIIKVENSLKALTELAKNYRQRFDYPIIGITGSIGKTSTKEILKNILQNAQIPAYVSFKTQNTSIGLSLNILNLKQDYKMAIFELGINNIGEMDELVDILRPSLAVITRIAIAHAQGLGDITNICREKLKIFKYFKFNNIGFICGDQPQLCNFNYTFPAIKFGIKTKNHVQARKITVLSDSLKFILKIYKQNYKITMNINNSGIVNNALAAASVAQFLNIDVNHIISGLQSYTSFENRFEKKVLRQNAGILISDCYNASPESMKMAILAFGKMSCDGPRIAVIGDMLELGEKKIYWHKQLGKMFCKALNVDHVILVGNLAKIAAKTLPVTVKIDFAQNWQSAKNSLENLLQNYPDKKPLVLVKASRGVGLLNLVKELSL